MTACGPINPETGRAFRCFSPPASGNVERCPLHEAAPELLSLLRLASEDPAALGLMATSPWLESVRDAIAKAEGRPGNSADHAFVERYEREAEET